MKKFCRYAVIDIKTGNLLAGGQKWKDFESGITRYVNVCTFRCFPCLWRKITEYFRTLEINGLPCVIVYWVFNKGKQQLYNYVTLSGIGQRLKGREYDLEKGCFSEVYGKLLNIFGVTYESI